jgi:hypothetical protein
MQSQMTPLKQRLPLPLTDAMYVGTMQNSCLSPAITIPPYTTMLILTPQYVPWSSLVKLVFYTHAIYYNFQMLQSTHLCTKGNVL